MRGRSLRVLCRGPHRGPSAILDNNYLALPEAPRAPEAIPYQLNFNTNFGIAHRGTYSSWASGDFNYLTSGSLVTGDPTGDGWMYSLFSKVPLWCESLFWWLLPVLLFLFLFLAYSAGSLLMPAGPQLDYGIVIDAGSHGSRINIFQWESRVYDPHNPLTGPVSVPKLSGFRVYSPGVSEVFKKPENGKQQLRQMVRDASADLAALGVPASRWGEIPIYLKATAGMRAVGQERRDGIMEDIRDTLHDKSINPFRFKSDFARVISGEEEGIYGWVAVNSQRNTLGGPPEKTVGALDMGGSSAQITFSPFYTSILEDFNSVHLGNTSLRLYSHSFLGYGWADALSRVNIRLAAEQLINSTKTRDPQPRSAFRPQRLSSQFMKKILGAVRAPGRERPRRVVIEHPCFPAGHTFLFKFPKVNQEGLRLYVDLGAHTLERLLEVLEVPVGLRAKMAAAAAIDGVRARHELQDEEGRQGSMETMARKRSAGMQTPEGASKALRDKQHEGAEGAEGDGNGTQTTASQTAGELFEASRFRNVKVRFKGNGNFDQCRARATEFLAFGQYAKVWAALGLPASPTLSQWQEKAREICALDKDGIELYRRQQGITTYSARAMRKLCWKATWSVALLVEGFGFSVDKNDVSFVTLGETGNSDSDVTPDAEGESDQNGTSSSIGWALGSMLVDVNFYPWGVPERVDAYFYIVSCIAVGLLALLVGMGHMLFRTEAELRSLREEAHTGFHAFKYQSAPNMILTNPWK